MLATHANVDLIWGDAMRLDLAALEPPPTAFVANLPYNVAAPLILRSIDALPTVRTWCCLVQREVADRFLAGAGESAYGAPSVLCALALEPVGRHAVSRSVFVPVPNVDSSLVAFRRRAEWPAISERWPAILARRVGRVRASPQDARELARACGLGVATRRRAHVRGGGHRSACPRGGAAARGVRRPCDRARVGARRVRALAPAKVNLVLRVGPKRRDGYHELASLIVALDVGDTVELESGAADDRRRAGAAGRRHAGARRPSTCSSSRAATRVGSP